MSFRQWTLRGKKISFSQPLVMGILNVTPDSFSDGGRLFSSVSGRVDVARAVSEAQKMIAEGAAVIDVGGESSRPGSDSVSVEEELSRVLLVVQEVLKLGCIVSIDTIKPEVAKACLEAGAHIVNDISGFRNPAMVSVCKEYACLGIGCIVMHMKGMPKTMQQEISYTDVVSEVFSFLEGQVQMLADAGLDNVMVDPGIGFGKDVEHNLLLLQELSRLLKIGKPVLVGASRKSLIGKITGAAVEDRLPGSIALHVAAVLNGADVVRVHDVKEHVQALQVVAALKNLCKDKKKTFYLGLGTNIGNLHENLDRCLSLLQERGKVVAASSRFQTQPFGVVEQPDFLNMAVAFETALSPEELFIFAKDIEMKMGRVHTIKNGPRIIDVDLLLCVGCVETFTVSGEQVNIPHRELHNRITVLAPLVEIAPTVVHPLLGKTIRELYDEVASTDSENIRKKVCRC